MINYKAVISIVMSMFLMFNTAFADTMDTQVIKEEAIYLSLEEATDYMLQNSNGAINAKLDYDATLATIKGYKSSIDNIEFIEDLNVPIRISLAVLGSGGSMYQKDLAILSKDYAENQLEPNYQAELNQLKYGLREKYFLVLQLKEALRIQSENLEIQKKMYNETSEKFKLGLVTKNDLSAFEVNVLAASDDKQSAENLLKLSEMDLAIYLGYELSQEIILTDTLEKLEGMPVDLETTIEQASSINNSIKTVEFALAVQERTFRNIDLRNSRSSNKYKMAIVDLERAKENYESTTKLVELDVRSKYMALVLNEQKIVTAIKQVESSKNTVEAAELSYELGLGTLLQVQQSRLKYTSDQLSLSQSILDYNLSYDQYAFLLTPGTSTAPIN